MISENIELVKKNISAAADRAGATAGDITLVAVSKNFPASAVVEAYECGITSFGENRALELREKALALDKNIEWHMIGQLQSNKIKYIISTVSLIQSVDRLSLASAINEKAALARRTIDVLLQVSLSDDSHRGGEQLADIDRLYDSVSQMQHICVRGLMCVPPPGLSDYETRKSFSRVRMIYDRLACHNKNMTVLSMGMSGDYVAAIEEGSNMIRLGSAIFGQRNYNINI